MPEFIIAEISKKNLSSSYSSHLWTFSNIVILSKSLTFW